MSAREITKELAGQEDLLFGQSTVNQTRNGTVYPITRVDKIHPVTNRAELKLLDVSNPNHYFRTVLLMGLTVTGTGWGFFRHDPSVAKASADDVNIIVDSAVGNGCWIRFSQAGEEANVIGNATASMEITSGLGGLEYDFTAKVITDAGSSNLRVRINGDTSAANYTEVVLNGAANVGSRSLNAIVTPTNTVLYTGKIIINPETSLIVLDMSVKFQSGGNLDLVSSNFERVYGIFGTDTTITAFGFDIATNNITAGSFINMRKIR
jgi:hypothetical protein